MCELIVESAADFAIFTIDRGASYTAGNVGAQRQSATQRNGLGASAVLFFTPEDRANHAPERETARARSGWEALDERWHQ